MALKKITNLRIDKEVLERVKYALENSAKRIRILLAHLTVIQHDDTPSYVTLNAYYQTVTKYISELSSILSNSTGEFEALLSKDSLDKMNLYKKTLLELEEIFSNTSNLSLKIH